jgi:hypothetical protein
LPWFWRGARARPRIPEAAAKLAKDLNAAKTGGTVTLSGWAGLNTALTVPEGVTLDLTQEGATLELQDGAVLTVNGTVRVTGHGDHGKGHVEGSLRVGDGVAVINGSGTISLTSKGRILNIGGDRAKQLTLDGVTLAGLPDNDHSLVGIYENSALILKSGAITGNTYTSDKNASGGGVDVWRGTFTMEGGTISGNSTNGKEGSGAGGVNIGEESVFTMSGGEITGNSATGGQYSNGGGVDVWRGTFTMEGGTISGNSAEGKEGSGGGGVNIGEEAVFTMTGGEITGNTATGGQYSNGGGVSVHKGTFAMEGGTISGNSVNGKEGSEGGGVNIGEEAVFTMSGGTISSNSANGKEGGSGGGVSIGEEAVFTLSGGEISDNTTKVNGGGVFVSYNGTFTMEGGTISGNTAAYGGGVRNRGGGLDVHHERRQNTG